MKNRCETCGCVVRRKKGQMGPNLRWCDKCMPESAKKAKERNAKFWTRRAAGLAGLPRLCLGHKDHVCTVEVTGRTQKRCASCMPLYREEYQKAWQATHPQKPRSQRVSRARARPEPDYTVPPTSRQSAASPVRMSDTAHCRAKRKDVTANICIESYTDANALGRQSSACYRCKAGRDLRALYAGGGA